MNLFDETRPFFKGNLHCHSTRSDGKLDPDEVIKTYQDLGYDFLSITDHRILSEPANMQGDMLMIPGIEMDFMLPGEALHIIGIGLHSTFVPSDHLYSPQECINQIRACGGRAILAHPAWSLNSTTTLCALRNLSAAEIYNSISNTPWNGRRADSSNLLDIAAAHGSPYQFVASDDSHFYTGEAGRGSTMVQADDLSQESILRAMDKGTFYCTQGPQFEQITLEGGCLSIRCSQVETIVFYSNLVWSEHRCISGENLTSGSYPIDPSKGESFLRVEIIDAMGNSAWSNPIALT
ncbi:MAG: hypothetical protein GX096_06370 [Clostridiales bacterium]|nr:hypothetical protein [Clostridiales bacterium]